MLLFFVIVLNGIIEGLTEFIPVSSTGHLIVLDSIIALEIGHVETFQISIQLGAILAACLHYRETFRVIVLKCRENISFFKALLAAMLPVFVIGFLAYESIKALLFHATPVAVALIVGGVAMILVDRFQARLICSESAQDDWPEPTFKQALMIGCFQVLSLWPGMSRSGSTIIGGVVSGLPYKKAADFSFILAVPVIGAAVVYDLLKSASELSLADVGYIGLGFSISFFVGILAINVVLKWIEKWKLTPFGIYRVGLGLLVLLMQ
ncbi:undecaprenyl-diphosphate phosphatase [Candidatus Marinamargulisbacteria bacterium SCGC AG-343-D04]|nr:undecaprenyl-diphosphate phosphatase [Candidatus Marinamargulisbacteria bacterium SCGC AG-343-D04]